VVQHRGTYEALVTNSSSSISPDLRTFLGLETGSLNELGNGNTTNGSFKQTFTANAGDVVTFDWNFVTNEEPETVLMTSPSSPSIPLLHWLVHSHHH